MELLNLFSNLSVHVANWIWFDAEQLKVALIAGLLTGVESDEWVFLNQWKLTRFFFYWDCRLERRLWFDWSDKFFSGFVGLYRHALHIVRLSVINDVTASMTSSIPDAGCCCALWLRSTVFVIDDIPTKLIWHMLQRVKTLYVTSMIRECRHSSFSYR